MASNPFITQASPTMSQILIDPEAQALQRQKQFAAMLMQQNQQPQGQMVSGRYVAPSWTEKLNAAINPLVGAYVSNQADTRQNELARQLRQETMTDIGRYMEAIQGKPETPDVVPQGQTLRDDQGQLTMGSQVGTPAVGPNYNKALAIALGSRSPTVQALGANTITEMTKPQKLAEGEQFVRFNPQSQKYETIGEGAPKSTNDIRNYEYDVSRGFKGSFNDWMTAQKRAGATNVNVSTEKSYGSAFGQGLAKNDLDLYDQATKAPEALENVQRTKKLLESGKVYVGFGANAKLDMARAADAFGVTGKDTAEKIANTQQLFANRAQATLDSVKASGLGAGNGFTNADREFLEKAKLGGITYDRSALQKQLDIEERVARAAANKWNTRFKSIPRSATEPTGINQVILPPLQGTINTGDGSGRWRLKETP